MMGENLSDQLPGCVYVVPAIKSFPVEMDIKYGANNVSINLYYNWEENILFGQYFLIVWQPNRL